MYYYLNESITNKEIDFIESFMSKSSKVLDLCCGHGRHTIKIKKNGGNVIGIDNCIEELEYAKAEALKENVDGNIFKNIDILKNDLSEKYDVILLLCNTTEAYF